MKFRRVLLALILATSLLALASCDNGVEQTTPAATPAQPAIVKVTLSVESDEEYYDFGKDITLSIKEISEEIPEESISWYVDGQLQSDTGSSITIQAPSVNKVVEAYAKVKKDSKYYYSDTISYNVTSNKELFDIFIAYMKEYNVQTGVTVSVYSKNPAHIVDFTMSGGYSSLDSKTKNTDSTLHTVCSITKSFTGAAISKMVHDGKISLTDTIEELLGEESYYDSIDKNKINVDATVLDLLEHRSGIYDFIDKNTILSMLSRDYYVLTLAGYEYPYKNGWEPSIVLNFATSNYDNTKSYRYSTLNYVILGLIIDKYSGTTYENYLRTNFLTPLGISTSDLIIAPREEADYSKVASAHLNPSLYSEYVEDFSFLLTLLGINMNGDNDLKSIVPDSQKMMCQLAWAGGGILSSARPCALMLYNLMSDNGIASTPGDQYSYFTQVRKDVDALQNTDPKTGYGIQTSTEKYFHGGRGIGSWNTMRYYINSDVVVVVIADCVEDPSCKTQNVSKLADSLAAIFAD